MTETTPAPGTLRPAPAPAATAPVETAATRGPGVPVFGRRSAPLADREFHLAVYLARNPNGEPELHAFRSWNEPDTGSIMQMLGARTEGEQGAAVIRILSATLRDDDGVSVSYVAPREPMTVDEFDEWVDDHADELAEHLLPVRLDTPEEYEAHELDRDDDDRAYGEVVDDPEDGPRTVTAEPWWLGPNGPTTDTDSLHPEMDEGSSARRFAIVLDSRRLRIDWSALQELAEFMAGEVTARPTRQPSPSQRGGRSTGSGSSAGRPGRASSRRR